MIKAVLWDIGGVILEDPSVGDFWKDKEGAEELRNEFGSNKINKKEFILRGAKILGINEDKFLKSYKKTYLNLKPIMPVYNLYINMSIDKYILSDTNPIHLDFVKKTYSKIIDSAKKVYFSVETGKRKNSEEIFEYVLNDIKLSPKEVLFIDNKKSIIEIAKKVGINTIHFTGFNKLLKELSNLKIK